MHDTPQYSVLHSVRVKSCVWRHVDCPSSHALSSVFVPCPLPLRCCCPFPPPLSHIKGTVEKQQSLFFMISVTEEMARDGLVLRCMSTNKSRFKLVVSFALPSVASLCFAWLCLALLGFAWLGLSIASRFILL